MSRTTRLAVAALACGALIVPAALAGPPKSRKAVWATVNLCDTKRFPNTMGVRVAMGATDHRDSIYARIRVQFQPAGSHRFRDLRKAGDSGWLKLGKGNFVQRQGGFRFVFNAPPKGERFVLRGRVNYQWRRGKRVIARRKRFTKAGHPGADQGDPKHYSARRCVIT